MNRRYALQSDYKNNYKIDLYKAATFNLFQYVSYISELFIF